MANYRPKSLDELNNLYGKSVNARNEIEKKASVLDAGNEKPEAAFLPEEEKLPEAKSREQLAADEITGLVGDFVKSFGTDKPAVRVRPSSAVPSGIKVVPKAEATQNTAEAKADDKPRLIRNTERNSLFENYKKVMDDEDDYDFADPRRPKKRTKKHLGKKGTADESPSSEVKSADAPEIISSIKENEGVALSKSAPKKEERELKTTAYVIEAPESESIEGSGVSLEGFVALDKEDEKASAEGNAPAVKAVLLGIMLLVMLITCVVGSVKAFSGINSNKLTFNYRLYTASADYQSLGISKGSLVIVENKAIDEGDIVAYEKSQGVYEFTKFEKLLNDTCFISDNGSGQKGVVFNNSIRGSLYKTVPFIGAAASLIITSFNTVVTVLICLIAVLALIYVFAFRKKEASLPEADDEPEEAPEAEAETQQEYTAEAEAAEAEETAETEVTEEEPERKKKKKKAKKEKKSRRSRKSEEASEDEQPEEATDYNDSYDYDALEADFSFLLNEEGDEIGDGYDDYRIADGNDADEPSGTEEENQSATEKYTIAEEE